MEVLEGLGFNLGERDFLIVTYVDQHVVEGSGLIVSISASEIFLL